MNAQRARFPDGRWHFQHGPIDVVICADGDAPALAAAHEASWQRFQTVLAELVAELPLLRQAVHGTCPLRGVIARRMWHACSAVAPSPEGRGRKTFITPMAAVAGSVADELIASYQRPGIRRAWVNNGGDIALHLAPGSSVQVGLYADLARLDAAAPAAPLRTDADFRVHAALPVRGVATSGWRGRSFSLGIADSVTVLARTAAEADAAATLIANAVDVPDPRIVRRPANTLKDDSDLGARLVTVEVPALEPALVRQALQAGQHRAGELQAAGLIWSAMLVCQGWFTAIDDTSPRRLSGPSPSATPVAEPAVGSVFA